MAQRPHCDGCGNELLADEKPRLIGKLSPGSYCPACAPAASEYLRQRDALHTEVARAWQEGGAKLSAEFREKIGGGMLPDEG